MLNKYIKLALLALLFASCSSTKPSIITTKKVAQNKGVYTKLAIKKLIKEQEERVEKVVFETSFEEELEEAGFVMSDDYDALAVDESTLDDTDESSEDNSMAQDIVAVALDYRGTPYRYGGMTRKGIDCSALMYNSFGAFDFNLPRTSFEQSKEGRKVKRKNAKAGDLIFFRTGRRKVINHVGLVVENTEGEIKFVHASSSNGVIISSLNESYYARAFVQINRVLQKE